MKSASNSLSSMVIARLYLESFAWRTGLALAVGQAWLGDDPEEITHLCWDW